MAFITQTLFVVLVVWCVAVHGHNCIHDKIDKPIVREVQQQYLDHTHETGISDIERQRRLSGASWQSLRIRVEWGSVDASLSSAQENFLRNKLIPDAERFWERALKVQRVNGNLFAKRTCLSSWNTAGEPCAEYADPTRCGSHSDTNNMAIPTAWFQEEQECPSSPVTCNTLPAGTGVAATDFVLFVTAIDTPSCSGGTLAYAAACQADQFDRPTMGFANFCPGTIDESDVKYLDQYSTAVHEIGHALIFSSSLFAKFRDANGDPLTARDANGEIADSAYRTYTCNGQTHTDIMPSDSIIQFFAERGLDSCETGNSVTCVHKMVTPKVQQIARAFFDCPTLQGMELENQDTAACQIVASHMESRVFMTSFMAPFSSHFPFVNPILLAVCEDSGWYKPDYFMADPLREGVTWGFKQGCGVAMEKCVTSGGTVAAGTPDHFCTSSSETSQCSLDRKAKAQCQLATYGSAIPAWFRYFGDDTTGGSFDTADYCPYHRPLDNRDCFDPAHAPADNFMGEIYSDSSLCFQSTLNQNVGGFIHGDPKIGCYQVTCNSATSLTVTIDLEGGGTTTVDCTDSSQQSVSGMSGQITCLDPAVWCTPPQFLKEDGTLCNAAGNTCASDTDCCFSCKNGRCCGRDAGDTCTSCTSSFEVNNCETCTGTLSDGVCTAPVNACNPTPCENGATCSLVGASGFACSCTPAWTGTTCTESICTTNPCQNGGTCSTSGDNFSCTCATGWTGNNCGTDINECSTGTPCKNGGSCTNTVGSFTCDCAGTGFTGSTCDGCPAGSYKAGSPPACTACRECDASLGEVEHTACQSPTVVDNRVCTTSDWDKAYQIVVTLNRAWNADYANITSPASVALANLIKSELAAFANVTLARLSVLKFTQGSVIAEVLVEPSNVRNDITPQAVARKFSKAVVNDTAALSSFPTLSQSTSTESQALENCGDSWAESCPSKALAAIIFIVGGAAIVLCCVCICSVICCCKSKGSKPTNPSPHNTTPPQGQGYPQPGVPMHGQQMYGNQPAYPQSYPTGQQGYPPQQGYPQPTAPPGY